MGGILADHQILAEVKSDPPFEWHDPVKQKGQISSGLSSYGVDLRVGYKFRVFSPINATEIDPKNFDPKCLVDVTVLLRGQHVWESKSLPGTDYTGHQCSRCLGWSLSSGPVDPICTPDNFIRIPPHSFALAETLEEITIPRDMLCVVVGKSTLARCGLIVNVTPGEPEWTGRWTVELSNTTPLPMRVYAGEGIMQCLFIRADAVCRVSYKDKKGRYQRQQGLTLPTAVGTNAVTPAFMEAADIESRTPINTPHYDPADPEQPPIPEGKHFRGEVWTSPAGFVWRWDTRRSAWVNVAEPPDPPRKT